MKRLETAVSGKGKVSRRSRLIVRNLNFNITRDDLKATFIPFGDIHSITLPTIEAKDGSLHNKGYGFVWYTFYHDAQKAIDGMNGKSVKMATSEGRMQPYKLDPTLTRQCLCQGWSTNAYPLDEKSLCFSSCKQFESVSVMVEAIRLGLNLPAVHYGGIFEGDNVVK